jgi:hypothetical protein
VKEGLGGIHLVAGGFNAQKAKDAGFDACTQYRHRRIEKQKSWRNKVKRFWRRFGPPSKLPAVFEYGDAMQYFYRDFLKFEFDPPERVEEYVAMEADVDLSEFDKAFWSVGEDFIFHRLEEYLDKYEDEFLEWVP